MTRGPWYRAGLRFECTRCGACCTGAGTVRVTGDESAALARRLGLAEDAFRARYTRRLRDGSTSLAERANGDCTFWSREHGCLVYEDRPHQCRTWPFWRRNVATPAHWARAAEDCPGIGRGPLHRAEAIRRSSAADGTSGHVPSP